ncbi:MAG: hypothetical protein DRP87_12070, partial [Spirochaetes bacterium]
MKFKITPEIIDLIIFGMENQSEEMVFDTHTFELVPATEIEPDAETDEERYLPLPEWNSTMGFQLMERFVAGLKNPLMREELRRALSTGRGVFRNFKNVIKQRMDIERLWFSFKERELKKLVLEWYNSYCEAWGLKKVSPEPEEEGEETEELILSDFEIRQGRGEELDTVLLWDRKAFFEMLDGYDERDIQGMYEKRREKLPNPHSEDSLVFLALTPGGEIAGFIWGVNDGEISGLTRIFQIYVSDEYKGLGLSRVLFDRYLSEACGRGCTSVRIKLMGNALN